MAYVGNTPFTAAFLTDTFSGNGSTVAFTMSVAPATTSSVIVAITGVLQDPSTYSVSGTTLTFSAAPPTGTSNISVRYLGIPASGVTTTAYRTVTDTTATAGQTTFSIPSYTVGYVDVYRNGSRLAASDYTATTGTSVVLVNGASVGDTITTESFYVSSVLNALPTTGGSISGQLIVNSATGQKPLIAQVNGTEVFEVDSAGKTLIGLSSSISSWGSGAGQQLQVTASGARYPGISSYAFSNTAAGDGAMINLGRSRSATVGTLTATQSGDALGYLIFEGVNSSSALTGGGYISVNQTAAAGASYIPAAMLFYTSDATNGAAEKMRIDSSGNLLVGTTTTAYGTISGRFISASPTSGGAGLFYTGFSGDVSTSALNVGKFDNNNTTSQIFIKFGVNNSGSGSGQINANGSSAAAFGSFSDSRLKENIVDLPSQLDNIMALRTVEFDYIESEGGGHQIGFIAQEVQEIYPDLVGEREDGMLTLTDLNKNDARLIKAIQELKALVDTQVSTITQLQADVAALKGNS